MTGATSAYHLRLAAGEADVQAAQRLRYQVFVEELGGDGPLVDHARRLEIDRFDAHAEHLLLTDEAQNVVGTYRFMMGEGAAQAGGFYTEGEFDLAGLKASGLRIAELGRSCVAEGHRSGMALYHLWHGLARIVTERGVDILFGTASFHGTDPDAYAPALSYLHHHHLAPMPLRARALGDGRFTLIPAEEIDRRAAMLSVPALIKSYLRLGGTIGEGVYIDHAFNTLDVLVMLNLNEMNARQRKLYTQGMG